MSQRPKTVPTRICLTASSSARLTTPDLASRGSFALMRLPPQIALSDLDRLSQTGKIHPQLVPLADDPPERLPGPLLAVRQEHMGAGCRQGLEPAQQVRLASVAAETAEGVDRRADRNLLTENRHGLLAVHQHPAERTVTLVTHNQDRRFGSRQVVPEVMQDAPPR